MPDPMFKIGDEVECELRSNDYLPRYNFTTDSGSSGKWIKGKVFSIRDDIIRVHFPKPVEHWDWPLEGHGRYDPKQWEWPGYLRLVKEAKRETPKYSLFSGYFNDLLRDGYFPEYDHLRKRGKK